ncbi:MerR family transcriptional regulator [Cohnella thermotolerans]|uniref:MerR family transcriptional regulator n=1 Tax=Cohnella thermotolerans TaxID=329858 RepID=UPI0009FE9B2C|nr:MerR family transcriptional regulator [Cohnella thermotolerans]
MRYYTRIGRIPPLELSGNKRLYTDNRLLHFRAIITLARTGETLAAIQERLKDFGDQSSRISPELNTSLHPKGAVPKSTWAPSSHNHENGDGRCPALRRHFSILIDFRAYSASA